MTGNGKFRNGFLFLQFFYKFNAEFSTPIFKGTYKQTVNIFLREKQNVIVITDLVPELPARLLV